MSCHTTPPLLTLHSTTSIPTTRRLTTITAALRRARRRLEIPLVRQVVQFGGDDASAAVHETPAEEAAEKRYQGYA